MNKKNKIKCLVIVVTTLVLLALAYFIMSRSVKKENSVEGLITVNGRTINVEIIETTEATRKGLSGRESICQSCGMLFCFSEPGNYFFTMENMKFPIDFIWIKGNRVVDVKENVSAEEQKLISSPSQADRVLEVRAGLVNEYGVKIGDIIELQ